MSQFTVLKKDLKQIATSFQRLSETTFQFRGHSINIDDQPWSLGCQSSELIQRWEHALAIAFYYGAYCSGPDQPFYMVDDSAPVDKSFVNRLTEANQTSGGFENGWHHVGRLGRHAGYTKAGGFRFPHQQQPTGYNAIAALPVERESRWAMPTFYVAYSQTLPNEQEDRCNVRFYMNCDSQSVMPLVFHITSRLNDARIPFRIKCVNHPDLFHRSDALVLYVEPRYCHSVWNHLWRLVMEESIELDEATPLFTKPLRPGIGISEDPGTGDSFGQSRCKLMAQSLLGVGSNDADGIPWELDPKAFIKRITQAFDEAGLNIKMPYLNSGNQDWLPDGREHARKAAKHKPKQPTSVAAAVRRDQFLTAAVNVARQLARTAHWSGQHCMWYSLCDSGSHQSLMSPPSQGITETLAAAPVYQLVSGSAEGIDVFLDRINRVQPAAWLDHMLNGLSKLQTQPDPCTPMDIGQQWGQLSRDTRYSEVVSQLTFCFHDAHRYDPIPLADRVIELGRQDPSFLNPLLADAFLILSRRSPDSPWTEATERLANHLLQQHEQFDLPWTGINDFPVVGLDRGIAGIGHFLLAYAVDQIPNLLSDNLKSPD